MALLSVSVLGCKAKHQSQTAAPDLPATAVRARKVETKTLPSIEEVLGTVRAKVRATLEAKISGRIIKMPVVLGQKVNVGDLLVRLDAPEIKAKLEEGEASLQQAERAYRRAGTLFEQQAMTRSEYEAAQARYLVDQASVAGAKAMLDYMELRAPFAGVITRKFADVGDLAAPGKPLLALEDASILEIEADVPEAIGSHIKQGATLDIKVDGVDHTLAGTVTEIAPNADSATRTRQVKLSFSDPAGVTPGQFARLAVPIGESASLRIPGSAVVRRGQLELAFVVEGDRARLHLVKSGRRLGDDLEILAGLEDGDNVVVEGASLLRDGQPVTLQ